MSTATSTRITIGGYSLPVTVPDRSIAIIQTERATVTPARRTVPGPRRNRPRTAAATATAESEWLITEPLVWTSPRTGATLSRGRALTQQQAIYAILTHTRNEIIESQTTATLIAYRTPNSRPGAPDSVTVYEGTRPAGARPAKASEAEATTLATPTAISAQPQTFPVTPAMRYRVWRQPHSHVDHAYQSGDEQFYVQTTTLAEAVQIERILEAYDTWCERDGEHDIEIWDGIAWSSDIDPAALSAAESFLRRIYDLDDVTPAPVGREGSRNADPA